MHELVATYLTLSLINNAHLEDSKEKNRPLPTTIPIPETLNDQSTLQSISDIDKK